MRNIPDTSNSIPSAPPWIRWAIVAVFALIYSAISLVNHYQFRTYAFDLGMFNHAIYDFAHLRWNHVTLDPTNFDFNYFGDHFSPITLFYAPFYYLFGSYSLLIIQIIAVLWAGVGVYKYAITNLGIERNALLLLFQFYGIWGIYFALSFDFHNNVIGTMLVPWLFYYYEKKNVHLTLLLYFLFLLTKENMALWGGFLLLGLWIKNKGWQDWTRTFRYELPLIIGSFIYFAVVLAWVMPQIRQGQGLGQIERYVHLGKTLPEIIHTLVSSPKYIFSLFLETPFQPNNLPVAGIKSELHFVVLLSGGICFIYRPYYFLMLVPIYAQKFLSNNYNFWGVSHQYSIEFAPILVFAVLDVAKNISSQKSRSYFIALFAILTHIVSYSIMDNSVCWFNKKNIRFFQADHYQSELPLATIYRIIDTLPKEVPLSLSATLTPHLFQREKLYNFPMVKDAKYIFLLTTMKDFVPFFKEDSIEAAHYRNNPNFEVQYDSLHILLLKRK